MTTQVKKQQSLFPDIPRSPFFDMDGKNVHEHWQLAFSNLFQGLQKNYKNEGILLPVLSTEDQTTIQNLYTNYIGQILPPNLADISGQMIFDGPIYGGARVPKVFVIDYNADKTISSAQWKSVTIT